jgi:hypothetical protein
LRRAADSVKGRTTEDSQGATPAFSGPPSKPQIGDRCSAPPRPQGGFNRKGAIAEDKATRKLRFRALAASFHRLRGQG